MIIFFDKTTKDIIGTIEGRVHHSGHLDMTVSSDNIDPNNVERLIIGYVDNGQIDNEKNPIYESYNLGLWDLYLDFEDPKNPKTAINQKVILDKKGAVIGFENK